MTNRSEQSRGQAEAAFRKTQKEAREKDKSQAMQEYEATAEATREKSARLRELRLAKEEADRQTQAASRAGKRRPKG